MNLRVQSSSITMTQKNTREAVSITASAANKLHSLLQGKNYTGIRITVLNNKGCYGKQYNIEYADSQYECDEVIAKQTPYGTVTILIDPKTLLSIIGTTVDYIEEKFSSGFIFNNPNEKGRCGCGKSFN